MANISQKRSFTGSLFLARAAESLNIVSKIARGAALACGLLFSLPQAHAAEHEGSAPAAEPATGTPAVKPATGTPAEETVERAVAELQGVLTADRKLYKHDPERFYADVEAALSKHIDFDAIAQGVMAQSYHGASPLQRARFALAFRSTLVRAYARAMLPFADYRIRVLPVDATQRGRDHEMVTSEATSPGRHTHFTVQYSVVRSKGEWRIGNIVIDGVNLGLIYRGQFAEAVNAGGATVDMDTVIAAWTPKPISGDEQPD